MNRENPEEGDSAAIPLKPWQWGLALVTAAVVGVVVGWVVAWTQTPRRAAKARSDISRSRSEMTPEDDHRSRRLITFSTSRSSPPEATAPLLAASSQTVYGFFAVPEGVAPDQLIASWWWKGEEMKSDTVRIRKTEKAGGKAYIELKPPGDAEKFGPGVGEVVIRHEERVLIRGAFILAADAENVLKQDRIHKINISNLRTVDKIKDNGKPGEDKSEFRPADRIFVAFSFEGAIPYSTLRVRWYWRDHELPDSSTKLMVESFRGQAHAYLRADSQRKLPPGNYGVGVFAGDTTKPVATCKFTVSGGSGGSDRTDGTE